MRTLRGVPIAVLDANTLFPMALCDLLIHAAIEAQSADIFLNSLFAADSDTVARIIVEQSERLRNPPQSVEQVLNNLSLEAPTFVRAISERMRQP